ncbi:hypothetical protein OS035_32160 [Rhizobium sp. 268]|uniref:hypothetical protein n=1 Tax=Rhizobium sp. 268 TaxID=2996375 RepID=UPI002F95B94D
MTQNVRHDPQNTALWLVGNIVDYDIFAEVSPSTSLGTIKYLLDSLEAIELEGRTRHDAFLRGGLKERFSNLPPGAKVFDRNPFTDPLAIPVAAFDCREISEHLALHLFQFSRGNPSSSND